MEGASRIFILGSGGRLLCGGSKRCLMDKNQTGNVRDANFE